MGLGDTLIEPENVVKHYTTYHKARPSKAFLKAFPKNGHLDFTIGLTDPIMSYVLRALQEQPVITSQTSGEDKHEDNERGKEVY
jgi:hypothetical protein